MLQPVRKAWPTCFAAKFLASQKNKPPLCVYFSDWLKSRMIDSREPLYNDQLKVWGPESVFATSVCVCMQVK